MYVLHVDLPDSVFQMEIITCMIYKFTVTTFAMDPVFIFFDVYVFTKMTWVIAFVTFFSVVPLLAL